METNQKPWKTMKIPWKTMETNQKPRKTMKLPWKAMETNQKPWKTMKLPWKTMETEWKWWFFVTDKQTDTHHNIYIIITIITIIIIIVIVVCFFSSARGMMCLLWVGPNLGFQCFEFKRSSDHKNTLYEITIWDLSSKRPYDWQGNARDQIMNQMTRKKSLEGKRTKQRNWLIVDPEIQIS